MMRAVAPWLVVAAALATVTALAHLIATAR